MKKIILISICFLMLTRAYAQGLINNGATIVISGLPTTIYIDGDANGNFVNQNNGVIDNISGIMYVEGSWTNNAATSDVFINNTTNLGYVYFNGAVASTIGGSRQTVFENIIILNANRTLQTTNCQSNGVLTLNNSGLLLNSNRFIVNNNSTSAISVISNGYIQSESTSAPFGELLWNGGNTTAADFIVPFGVGNTAAQKFDMVIRPTLGTIGSFTVATYPTAISNLPFPPTVTHVKDYTTGADQSVNAVDRFWKLEASGTPTIDLTLNCQLAEAPAPIASPLPQRWVAASDGWELPTNLGTPTPISGTAGKISGLVNLPTWWTMASLLTPLPINLKSFNATCSNNNIVVNWSALSKNADFIYEIQTSLNGFLFTTQKEIFSRKGLIDYSEILANNNNEESLYTRLKITNKSGEAFYSHIVSLSEKCNTINKTVIKGFYQNTQTSGTLFIDVFDDEELTVQVFDYRGRLLVNENKTFNKGQQTLTIDLNEFSNSLYLVNLIGKNGSYSATKIEVVK